MTSPSYVLLTAARNEERFIAKTIESVLSQSILPVCWVIANDGSTDGTADTVARFCSQHSFLRLVSLPQGTARGVVSKINALRQAFNRLERANYEFIGNLDADISLDRDYYKRLLQHFEQDQKLGIAAGVICEKRGSEFKARISNNNNSVAHGAQLVRKQCYDAIGGYVALKHGGEDWCAEVSAAMRGWKVRSFAELEVHHHRNTGSADRILAHRFRQGRMDYSFGSHPIFELLKCARRTAERPVIAGAAARLAGFIYSYLDGESSDVPEAVAQRVRQQQRQRLSLLFSSPHAALSAQTQGCYSSDEPESTDQASLQV